MSKINNIRSDTSPKGPLYQAIFQRRIPPLMVTIGLNLQYPKKVTNGLDLGSVRELKIFITVPDITQTPVFSNHAIPCNGGNL